MVIVNTDFDEVLYEGKYRNFSIDNINLLDKKYGYDGILPETLDVLLDSKRSWSGKVKGIAQKLGDYEVSLFDDISAAQELVKSSHIPDEMKKTLEMISPEEMNIFTGSVNYHVCLYAKKLKSIIPDTKIRIFGTNLENSDGYHTGKVLELWNPNKRVQKAKELSEGKTNIGFGNFNDIPMLKEATISYLLLGPVTSHTKKIGTKEGPIVYTDLKNLPFHVEKLSV